RDGKLLLTGGEDSTVRLWDLETGKEVRRFEGHEGKVRAVAFSADGKQAVSGTILGDPTLRVWGVETGKELPKHTLAPPPAPAPAWAVRGGPVAGRSRAPTSRGASPAWRSRRTASSCWPAAWTTRCGSSS